MQKGYRDYTRTSGEYIDISGPPSSPGKPFSVPTANGSGPNDRYMPGYSTVASSSFHAAGPNAYGNHASVPAPGLWAQSASMRGTRGAGHGRQHDDSWQAVVGSGGSGYGGMNANGPDRHKAKGIARAQVRLPRAPSDSPNKKAAKERKAAHELANTADAVEQQAAASKREAQWKKRAMEKAKSDKAALEAKAEQERAKNATDLLFEQKMARQQSTESGTSKAKRKDSQEAHYYVRENKQPKSKKRRSSQSEAGPSKLKKARGGRDGFDDSDEDGRLSTPPSSPRRSPRRKDKGKGRERTRSSGAVLVDDSEEELEIVEKEKTLEELFRQEREEADEADRAERGESAMPEATRALLRLRADRLDSPDPLLENDHHVVDPDTLCPFCDGPFPDDPSNELLRLKRYLLSNPDAECRPTMKNRKAIRLPNHVVATAAFCQRHRNEREVIPEGLANGYPRDIDFDELPKRISRLLTEHLRSVLMGNAATPFLEPAIERVEAAGRRRNVIGEFGSFDIEEPGYYGPRGLEVMFATIKRLFTEHMPLLTAQRTHPLDINFYVRRVLVPECAVELIRHDFGYAQTTRERAEEIREDSRAYGKAVFPSEADMADDGRGMTVSPEKRKKRSRSADGSAKKRKKRKEVEIVESDAEDSPSPSPVKQVSRPAFRQPKQLRAKEGTGSAASSSASSSKSLASGSGKSSKTTALTIPSSESDADKPPASAQSGRKLPSVSSSGLFADFKRDVEEPSSESPSASSSSDDELKEVSIELNFAKRNARAEKEEKKRKRKKAAAKAAKTRKARQERGKETVLSSSESD
ncbi:Proteophosphoglycan ppg4 [Rhodotorula toruloides ATCC 204091]|uniref:Restriction of telomere capping protein 4 n=1 Tax=Rhodotorula toruloides TaxID=5286 RepID=A0A0K3C727_RHOTO|nr:Proteophosphoglycan ppg4 [Rhodotorula toruloides ATCC 204091]